ncbi:MAG: 30S ribosomal protein S15 [Candidatus Jacksonbacteria bacterium]|nr:30S ribosomal protein S15 [Candidatus Jacksonbacteria bacterium]MBT6757324.1 30S ribosomal protein S15 [Candidatus Jacksonbacteria bacterium]MBT7007898.1 30S ribosomal protein S15 [Candidatus Jacksonbacteria bacterium]MBT7339406.1 30S ribosomal protein S15 [Candidatus Jacksonbacteria bacterium]
MLDKKRKDKVIEKFRTHKSDTGSTEVQIALLTEEIRLLTGHLKKHKKDVSSRRGLIRKVSQRRRLLRYLEREDEKSYNKILKVLEIRPLKKQDSIDDDIAKEAEEAVAEDKDEKLLKEVAAEEKAKK